jgi:hypothetical protein
LLEKTDIKDGKVTIKVSQPKLVGGGFFSTKEIAYTIHTEEIG